MGAWDDVRGLRRACGRRLVAVALGFSGFTLAPLGAAAGTQLVPFVSGVFAPVCMVPDPTNRKVLFVLQQDGRIRKVVDGALSNEDFLDLRGTVIPWEGYGSERGLLGLAFHPDYAINRHFYVSYVDPSGASRIVRYSRDVFDPLKADPSSAYPILRVAQPYPNHNGGTIRFGPNDRFLYVGFGDGGAGNDPGNRAQTLVGTLLGKMLRLDVDGDDFPSDPERNYRIPPSNPFVGVTGEDEIWSIGLRNPWKWSFDPPHFLGTGGMWIADVGQDAWEEVDYEPPNAGGRNYGWRVKEGNHFTGLSGGGNSIPFTDPIHEYDHPTGESITGWGVYRGTLIREWFGRYLFCDFDNGRTWSLGFAIDPKTKEATKTDLQEHTADLGIGGKQISSVDVDADGELYVMDYFGQRIWRVMPQDTVWLTGIEGQQRARLVGGIRHVLAVDDRSLRCIAVTTQPSSDDPEMLVRWTAQTDRMSQTMLTATLRAATIQQGNATLEVGYQNWDTHRVDWIATFSLSHSMQSFVTPGVSVGSYRRNDGRIEIVTRAKLANGSAPAAFWVDIDFVSVSVE